MIHEKLSQREGQTRTTSLPPSLVPPPLRPSLAQQQIRAPPPLLAPARPPLLCGLLPTAAVRDVGDNIGAEMRNICHRGRETSSPCSTLATLLQQCKAKKYLSRISTSFVLVIVPIHSKK